MRETEWVDLIANSVKKDLADSAHSLRIETQLKIPYG